MKALVVDDSGVMRKVLIGALKRCEINDVDEAGDGEEAIELAKNNRYEIILMDWNMPKRSGLEAVKTIRGMGLTMPIIMVTTEAEKSRVVDALKAGASNYVIKPFEPSVIVGKIRSALGIE